MGSKPIRKNKTKEVTLTYAMYFSLSEAMNQAEDEGAEDVDIVLHVKDKKVIGGRVIGFCRNQYVDSFGNITGEE